MIKVFNYTAIFFVLFGCLSCLKADDLFIYDQARRNSPSSVFVDLPIVALIDGKSFGINGVAFGLILKVRREIKKRLHGVKSKDGVVVGLYEFEGKKYNLEELAKIEMQHNIDYFSNKEKLERDELSYSKEEWNKAKEVLEQGYSSRKDRMREVLEWAKDDFISISSSYVKSARGVKFVVLSMIQESCKKRNIDECFILKWGEEEEGKEGEALKSDIDTFKEFAIFCFDLSNFLEDLARSCPKAKAQFIELFKNSKIK